MIEMRILRSIQNFFHHLAAFVGRHRRGIILSLALVVVIEVIVQIAYPTDRATPISHYGLNKQVSEPAQMYQEGFAGYRITIATHGKTSTVSFADVGGSLDIDVMLAQTAGYPLWARLIPFSILWHQSLAGEYSLSFQDEQLRAKAAQIAKDLSQEPVSAGVEINSGQAVVSESKDGWSVDTQAVMSAIQDTHYGTDAAEVAIAVEANAVQPEVSTAAAQSAREVAQAVISNTFIIHIPGHDDVEVTSEIIAQWLEFTKNDEGRLMVSANDKMIKDYTNELNKDVATVAGTTTVQYRDGKEVSRATGKSGTGIDQDKLREMIVNQIENPSKRQSEVQAVMVAIKPTVKNEYSYSGSQEGLQAYVKNTTKDGSIKISVQQIGGAGWSANGGASDSFVSASTYKPYVMLRMFDDIDDGTLRWSSTIDGMTMADCLEKTIVVSANECAMALTKKYGGTNLTNYLHKKGFSNGTGFTFSDAAHTTAGDLTKYMVGLEQGTLVSGANRTKLLDAMSRQVYRQGVPAGTSAKVADKVGFLWDYLNDTAIVYHPQGTYIITVLTKGQSWAKIAEITRQVEKILYG